MSFLYNMQKMDNEIITFGDNEIENENWKLISNKISSRVKN